MQACYRFDDARLKDFAIRMLDHLGIRSAEILVLIVDDPTIAELNLRHLKHEGPTDILTFPISDPGANRLEGEMVISAPWTVRVATENGDDPFDELLLYVAHGILHLTGQDDISETDSEAMKRREFEVLKAIGAAIPKARFELGESTESRN